MQDFLKKRIALFLLCAVLLCTGISANAAGGSSSDPLISLSYLEDTFLPRLRESLGELISNAEKQDDPVQPSGETGWKLLSLHKGDSLRLGAGQQLVLISGAVRLSVERGTMLNLTLGRTSSGGDARVGHRYLLCTGSAAGASVLGDTKVAVSAGAGYTPGGSAAITGTGSASELPFQDMKSSDWFYQDVVRAYQMGLINGLTETSYAPQSTLTAAQAVKLAACMHQKYHTGAVTLKSAGDGRAWYMSYVDYAGKNGILEQEFSDYNAPITRGEFVKLFYLALPETEYVRINTIMDGAIPDIATDAPLAKQVYTFYMAGILTGYTAGNGRLDHEFGAESTITRAEVASIMSRMFNPEMRQRFSME